jgi:glycosyltransferase involved in cell wall biosynthesis
VKNLLVFAYSVSPHDQVFSHQFQAIESISKQFSEVTVVVPKKKDTNSVSIQKNLSRDSNIEIFQIPWKERNKLRNFTQLIKATLRLAREKKIDIVFFFMTDTYAAILGPILFLKRLPQVLWYAHASKPKRLIALKPFMTLICSSTSGSIPLKGRKIRLIGQMVDEAIFEKNQYSESHRFRLIHVGRFDPSKRIEVLIEVTLRLKHDFPEVNLTLYGSPTTSESLQYQTQVKEKYKEEIIKGSISIKPAIERKYLSKIYREFGVFIHAFQGSLDKSVIEATISGLPVASLNLEYISEFGSWAGKPTNLQSEIAYIFSLSLSELEREIERRRLIAIEKHSLDQWSRKIGNLLNG